MADNRNRELLKTARREDRRRSIELIQAGADPFHKFSWCNHTAFHRASARNDLDLMLHMSAEPGSPWEQRFLLSRGRIVNVPVHGRESIRLLSSRRENFFTSERGVSGPGLEVLLMYGYTLKQGDFEQVASQVVESEEYLEIFKFAIAAGLFHSRAGDSSLNWDECLRLAVQEIYTMNRAHRSKLAITILNAGCDPNYSYNNKPMLYFAVDSGNEEMAKLLVTYGADLSKIVRNSRWRYNEDGQLIVQVKELSIASLASERGMQNVEAEPLLPPVNVEAYVEELRRDFGRPIKVAVKEYSSLLVVAMMRSTGGEVPPVGLFSEMILSYCPLGFNLWKIKTNQDGLL